MTDQLAVEIAKIEQRRKADAAKLRRLQRQQKKRSEAELLAAKQRLGEKLAEVVGAQNLDQIAALDRLIFETGRDTVLREELERFEAESDDTSGTNDGDHVSLYSGQAGQQP